MANKSGPQLERAIAQLQAGQAEAAIAPLRRMVQKNARDAKALYFLGLALQQTGETAQAEHHLKRAILASPGEPRARAALANLRSTQGQFEEAAALFHEAIEAQPDFAPAWLGLGTTMLALGRPTEAEDATRRAIKCDPHRVEPHANLGIVLLQSGRADDAISQLREAINQFPNDPRLLSTLAFATNYSESVTPEELLEAHRAIGRCIEEAIPADAKLNASASAVDATRPIRIAFLSSDFYTHSVAYFIEPLLAHLDRTRFEVFCYYTGSMEDDTTRRLKEHDVHWRQVAMTTDDALAQQIHSGGIDVLIDLAGLTSGHRLGVLARRPAPVQMTYLGYPNTTGVTAIDNRLIDAITDPQGTESASVERLLRLDGCFLCYQPPHEAPEPTVRDESEPVTFGSFNNLAKCSAEVVGEWAALLREIPDSRMILKARALDDTGVKQRILTIFNAAGVDSNRVEMIGRVAGRAEHLAMYNRIDIALDTFPYHGTTTTFEALWMGVPVVSRAGTRHASRVGTSILHHLGLDELIAQDTEASRKIVCDLAADRGRRCQWRLELRDRLRTSALCDGPDFARRFERAITRAIH